MTSFNLLNKNHLDSILGIYFDNLELFDPNDRHSILSIHFRVLLKLNALDELFEIISYLVRHFLFDFIELLELADWIFPWNI